jgi:hypothetical protein
VLATFSLVLRLRIIEDAWLASGPSRLDDRQTFLSYACSARMTEPVGSLLPESPDERKQHDMARTL